MSDSIVFLLDVDNTLLDNDRVTSDLKQHLTRAFGAERQERYWTIFEKLRVELGYADYLGALQQYRAENTRDPHFLRLSYYLLDYPFAERLYPEAMEALEHLSAWGPTVILTDGDVVFQPRKIERSGLFHAVDGRVLIYIHKEQELDDVEKNYPADHYVLVDDKLRILSAVKKAWAGRLTTVFPRQGHYAHDLAAIAEYPAADITVESIGDLLQYDRAAFLRSAMETSS
ncbi:MAG TPA: HAD family hydrolase [Armatimonadota bacterium]|nr:HAD family hydrolase [Armatimonadota bacterium]